MRCLAQKTLSVDEISNVLSSETQWISLMLNCWCSPALHTTFQLSHTDIDHWDCSVVVVQRSKFQIWGDEYLCFKSGFCVVVWSPDYFHFPTACTHTAAKPTKKNLVTSNIGEPCEHWCACVTAHATAAQNRPRSSTSRELDGWVILQLPANQISSPFYPLLSLSPRTHTHTRLHLNNATFLSASFHTDNEAPVLIATSGATNTTMLLHFRAVTVISTKKDQCTI